MELSLLVCVIAACILVPLVLLTLSILQFPCFFSLMRWMWPDVLWEVDTGGERIAALTIDDSPTDALPEILDVLAHHDVRATFFFISGQLEDDTNWLLQCGKRIAACLPCSGEKDEDDALDIRLRRTAAVHRLVQEGHELANHGTEDHKAFCLGSEAFKSSLLQCEKTIEDILRKAHTEKPAESMTPSEVGRPEGQLMQSGVNREQSETSPQSTRTLGSDSGAERCLIEGSSKGKSGDGSKASADAEGLKFYRPGGGAFHRRMLRDAAAHAYRIVLGNVFPYDAGPPCFRCPHRIKICWLSQKVRPGSIIIIHDRWYTPAVLEEILPRILDEKKIKLVPLSQLLAISHPLNGGEKTKVAPEDAAKQSLEASGLRSRDAWKQ